MRKLNILPLAVLFLFSILLDYYVFGGIRTITKNLNLGAAINLAYWLISLLITSVFIFQLIKVLPTRKFNPVFNISFNLFITFLVTKFVFAALLLLEDLVHLGGFLASLVSPNYNFAEDRSATFSQIALFASSVPFFSFLFGVTLGKYHYKVRKTTLHFRDLPDEFHNFRIVQISDIHAGSFDNPDAVQKGVDLINAQKPDILVFTGDLVNNKATEIVPFIDMFSRIEAKIGKFSVLGNHDYGDYLAWPNAEEKRQNLIQLKNYHAQIGFRLLLDEHAEVSIGNSSIAVLGVENWGKGFGERGDLKKALSNVDPEKFKILLSHDPSHWDEQVKNNPVKIHLSLSGHTHGMQFGIEIGKLKWSPAKYRYPNWAGLAEHAGRYLYVNRGFGFLGFSGRVGIWPEITVINLRRN